MQGMSTATIAPAYTLLGKLQRGLGAGYLETLRIERDAAHELLYACLGDDPRHDQRSEARGRYYGELCLETQIDLGELALFVEAADTRPATRRLVLETVGWLAWRGIGGPVSMLRDYIVGGGEDAALASTYLWHPRTRSSIDEALLARYGSSEAVEEALALARSAPPASSGAPEPPAGEPLALVEALALALERDECVCELARGIGPVAGDPFALLERAFRSVSRSSCRVTIAQELSRDGTRLPARAREWLWDAEPAVVVAALGAVEAADPATAERMASLRRDGWPVARGA